MNRRLAILCPGQGGQHAQMFDVLGNGAHATALLEQWRMHDALGLPTGTALQDPAHLYANRSAQPLIVAATLAAWEAVKKAIPQPALIAGYSIGELSAYAVAGSLPPTEALALAAARARIMDACIAAEAPQAMLAVSGLPLPLLREMLPADALFIAIETGKDSAIVGGVREGAEAFRASVEQRGARATPLPMGVASHTPLMRPAVAPFHSELRESGLSDPHPPVICGVSAEGVNRRDRAMETLARQLAETVVWDQCMDSCAEAGITIALELGPGRALSRMLEQRHPHIVCRSVCEFRSVAGVAAWISRHFDE